MLCFLGQPALTTPDIQDLTSLSFSPSNGPLSELLSESSGFLLTLRLGLKPAPAKPISGLSRVMVPKWLKSIDVLPTHPGLSA